MITENKYLKLAFFASTVLYVIAVCVCFICDLAINKGVTWSAYPFGGAVFAWLITSSLLLAKKNRMFYALIALTVATIPLLCFLEWIMPVKGWFTPLALPLAVAGIAALWLTYLLLKYLKINRWYLFATIFFIYGVVLELFIEYRLAQFLDESFFSFGMIVNFVTSVVITALLGIIGYYHDIHNEKDKSIPKDNE